MKLTPLHDFVLVKIDEKVNKTAGGLILTDDSSKPSFTGVVSAVGPEVKGVAGGDRVYFTYKDGIATDDKIHIVLPIRSIVGIIA